MPGACFRPLFRTVYLVLVGSLLVCTCDGGVCGGGGGGCGLLFSVSYIVCNTVSSFF